MPPIIGDRTLSLIQSYETNLHTGDMPCLKPRPVIAAPFTPNPFRDTFYETLTLHVLYTSIVHFPGVRDGSRRLKWLADQNMGLALAGRHVKAGKILAP